MNHASYYDVIIIGAGAAGLMCAIEAGKRHRSVLVLDHANKVGKKILMSGGGRCNFTNYYITPDKYLSYNKHFCKSALSRFTQWDFIALVEKYKIKYHEKSLGELFCDNKSKDIVDMLLSECKQNNVKILLESEILSIDKSVDKKDKFIIKINNPMSENGSYISHSLVIATGGLSIPTMGATGFAYNLAREFGLSVYSTRAGLVPLTLHKEDLDVYSQLSGVSCQSIVTSNIKTFNGDFLFTHRGLSGPAVLQISSYWSPGEFIDINLCPDLLINLDEAKNITSLKYQYAELSVKNFLLEYLNLSKRIVLTFLENNNLNFSLEQKVKTLNEKEIVNILKLFTNWRIKPNGTEGYRTAEVTIGGIDCNEISSKTMECNKVPGLYFIGECLDVTGWLGGYNFQWAWSSGYAAGQFV